MGANGNFEAFHNLARRYVLGGLSFWDAITEAARLDPQAGIEGWLRRRPTPAGLGATAR